VKWWIVSWHLAIMLSGTAYANTDAFAQYERPEPISNIADLMAQSTTPQPAPSPTPAPTQAPAQTQAPATTPPQPAPAQPAPAEQAPAEPGATPPAGPAAPAEQSVLPNLTPDPNAGTEEEVPLGTADDEGPMGPEDVPVVETTELSADMAKRAIDVYALVREKYKDAEIEQYDNLQDFVDQNPKGKEFEVDIKAAGFQSVNDWNLAVTTASFTYTNIVDDQTDDIKQQIEEIKKDADLSQEVKDRMASSLAAMIPSDNNRKVIEDLMKDPAYAEKVKILQVEEE
jgi:hypothetical protein